MLRRTVQVIALIEGGLLLAFVVLGFFTDSDPAGDAMAAGFVTVAALGLAIFVLPALIAVRKNRFLWPALALLLVPPVVLLISIGGIA